MSQALPGERSVSPVAAERPRIKPKHILVLGLIIVLMIVMWSLHRSPTKVTLVEQPPTIAQVDQLEMAPIPKPTPVAVTPPPAPMPLMPQSNGASPPPDSLADARKAPMINQSDLQDIKTAMQAPATEARAGGPAAVGVSARHSELGDRLQPTVLVGSRAVLIQHPELTITKGTVIPCTLVTALASDTPGFVTCTTTNDVTGTTQDVVLLPRGSRIFGEYRSDIRPGQSRIFVVWDSAETPDHVQIDLSSPGTDALGRNGFDGQVDNHWWSRFGAALMFTLIDSGTQIATSQLSKNGQTSINFSEGQNVADTSLNNMINIPPTITKNQGESVMVMVARNLDFSDVYSLRVR